MTPESVSSVNEPADIAELASLFFPRLEALGRFEPVTEDDLAPAYQSLLAHDDHMTVTIEAIHNSLVNVHVLDVWQEGDLYARKILLSRQKDDRVVLFGIMRMDLSQVRGEVRREIEEKGTPLGRVLIRHHVMRHVELSQLYRVAAGEELAKLLDIGTAAVTFGRTARIHVAGRPAVQLLEIVTPVENLP
jgi:chorismate-pyruvate lyase